VESWISFQECLAILPSSENTAKYRKEVDHTPLTIKIDSQLAIIIPLVRKSKYLGIFINRNLRVADHLEFLKKKRNYISNSFLGIRKASQSTKFCFNMWQVFIRPLLDYASVYTGYIPKEDQEQVWLLHWQSLRSIIFLRPYTPKAIADRILQYPYEKLATKYIVIPKQKALQRA